MSRLISLALAAALAATAAQPADAAVNKGKVRKVMAPLIGYWAVDCSRAPGPENPWETLIVSPEGYVMDADYEGTDGEEAYVVDARRVGSDQIWFRWEVTLGEPELELVYKVEGDRQMTWSSRDTNGDYLIRDGKWVGPEPGESVWYHRCPNRFPDEPNE